MGKTVGVIGAGDQGTKIIRAIQESDRPELRDVTFAVYSGHSSKEGLEARIKQAKEEGELPPDTKIEIYARSKSQDEKASKIDYLREFTKASDTIVVTSALNGFADTLFEGNSLEGSVEVLSRMTTKDVSSRELEELKKGSELYELLRESASIRDFTYFARRDEDGGPLRNRKVHGKKPNLGESWDLALDPLMIQDLSIDYRALRFLPRSAFLIKELAEDFRQVQDVAKDKPIILFTNQTDACVYIFAYNSGLVDNVFGFNHTEKYRLNQARNEGRLIIHPYFVDPFVAGHHSFPSFVLPRDLSRHFQTKHKTRRALEVLDNSSEEFSRFSLEHFETRGALKDAALATEELVAAVFNNDILATPGLLMTLGGHPLYQGALTPNLSLKKGQLNQVFPASWIGSFNRGQYSAFMKETLEWISPRIQKIEQGIKPETYQQAMQAFVMGVQERFARTLGAFEILRGPLSNLGLIGEDGITPTQNMKKYAEPSSIQQKPYQIQGKEADGSPPSRGQSSVGKLARAAARVGPAKRRAGAGRRPPPSLDPSIKLSLFATMGSNLIGEFDVRTGDKVGEQYKLEEGYTPIVICANADKLAVLAYRDTGEKDESRLFCFDLESRTLSGSFEVEPTRSQSIALCDGYAFVPLEGQVDESDSQEVLRSFNLKGSVYLIETCNEDTKKNGKKEYQEGSSVPVTQDGKLVETPVREVSVGDILLGQEKVTSIREERSMLHKGPKGRYKRVKALKRKGCVGIEMYASYGTFIERFMEGKKSARTTLDMGQVVEQFEVIPMEKRDDGVCFVYSDPNGRIASRRKYKKPECKGQVSYEEVEIAYSTNGFFAVDKEGKKFTLATAEKTEEGPVVKIRTYDSIDDLFKGTEVEPRPVQLSGTAKYLKMNRGALTVVCDDEAVYLINVETGRIENSKEGIKLNGGYTSCFDVLVR